MIVEKNKISFDEFFKKKRQDLKNALIDFSQDVVFDAEFNILKNNSRAFGLLLKSNKFKIKQTNTAITSTISNTAKQNGSFYADNVENGQPPNSNADYFDILKWAKQKESIGLLKINNNIKSFAYFVSKKIERFGTVKKPFLINAIEDNKTGLEKGISEAILK